MTKYQKIAYGILVYTLLATIVALGLSATVINQARYIEELEYEVNKTYEQIQMDIYYDNYDPCGLEVVECYPQEQELARTNNR